MKWISEKITPAGKRRVIVEVEHGEKLIGIRPDRHYKLAQPVDDVVGSHIIADADEVTWCSASQEWV
jgi:hypothetical protein